MNKSRTPLEFAMMIFAIGMLTYFGSKVVGNLTK